MANREKRVQYKERKYWIEGKQVTVRMVMEATGCAYATAYQRIMKYNTLSEIFKPVMELNIEWTLSDGRKVNTKDVVAANPKISMALAFHRLKKLNVWEDIIRDPEQQGGNPKGVPASRKIKKPRTMVFGIDPLTVLAKPVKIDEDED
jgi:hypothetical protein